MLQRNPSIAPDRPVMKLQMHVKGLRDLPYLLADPSVSDNPDRLEGKLAQCPSPITPIRTARPFPISNCSGMILHSIRNFQEKGKSVLCHGVRAIRRDISYRNS